MKGFMSITSGNETCILSCIHGSLTEKCLYLVFALLSCKRSGIEDKAQEADMKDRREFGELHRTCCIVQHLAVAAKISDTWISQPILHGICLHPLIIPIQNL
jgi:hypothetical protein